MKKKVFEDGNRALFETDNEEELLLKFSDNLVDAKGNVKGTVKSKSAANTQLAVHLYKVMSSYHLPGRFTSQKSAKELVIKRADLFPFYVQVSPKNEESDAAPVITYYALDEKGETEAGYKVLIANGDVTKEQLAEIRRFALKMNVILKDLFQRRHLELLGFRAQFGVLPNDSVGLCSELTFDTIDLKDSDSRTKYTTSYMISHIDQAAKLYEEAIGKIFY